MAKPKSEHGLPDAIERREILAGNPKYRVDLADQVRIFAAALLRGHRELGGGQQVGIRVHLEHVERAVGGEAEIDAPVVAELEGLVGLDGLVPELGEHLVAEVAGRVYKKVCHTLMFLPYFISWVTASALMYNFFNYEFGLVNTILRSLGKEALDIYSEPAYWYFILPFLHVWKWVGFGSILYLASIMSIDQEQYESATIDGANSFQKIKYITIPSIVPTMVILLLLNLGQIFRGQFDMFYQLIGNNGLLMDATDIIDTYVYRLLMVSFDMGLGTAAGLSQSFFGLLVVLGVNGLIRKVNPEYALF
jgi:ABC-type polysaccharide transport system permease subunit